MRLVSPGREAPKGAPSLAHRRKQAEMLLEMARLLTGQDRCVSERLAAVGITDITPAQSRVLMILFQERKPLTARELADRMGVSQPTMSRFVKTLVDHGWLTRTRCGDDRRAYYLDVTPAARERLPQLIRASNAILDRLFGDLSDDELDTLGELLIRIGTRLDG